MAKNKPSTSSAALLDTRSATELERLSRTVGAPVDEKAIDRILEVIELAGKTGILAEGFDPATLDLSTTVEIKRFRWGADVRWMLSFLTARIHQRKLSTLRTRRAIAKAKKLLSSNEIAVLRSDQAYDAALKLAEMALERVQESLENARTLTDGRIAGQVLPKYYTQISSKKAVTTRKKIVDLTIRKSETMSFIQAVLKELHISYSDETIISLMQDFKPPKQYR